MVWVAAALGCSDGDTSSGCPVGATPEQEQSDLGLARFCRNELGLHTGPYTLEDASGTKLTEGAFEDGLADGLWRFYSDGALVREETYRRSLPHGAFRAFDGEGLIYEHWFAFREPCGVWKDRVNGALVEREPFGACDGAEEPDPAVAPTLAPLDPPAWDGKSCPVGSPATDAREDTAVHCEANGVWDGPFGRWVDGSPRVVGQYSGGRAFGVWNEFHPNGVTAARGTMAGGRDGEWRAWRADRSLLSSATYSAGVLEGTFTSYLTHGGTSLRGRYSAGARDGLWEFFSANGVRESNVTYSRDQRHGPFESWFENGNPRLTGQFEDDLEAGPWVEYYPSGGESGRGPWVRGRKHGFWSYSTIEGFKDSEGEYQAGKRHGAWTLWEYRNDPPIEASGSFLSNEAEGLWVAKYVGGGAAWEGAYANSLREGPYVSWWPNGAEKTRGVFRTDLEHGPWTGSHENGAPSFSGSYEYGRPVGWWVEWWPNGQPRSEGEYAAGVKIGQWTYYREDGSVERVEVVGGGG